MTPRLDYYSVAPKLLQPMLALEQAVASSGLEHSLIELVKIRVSLINGCAFCLDMHTRDAMKAGETLERLFLLGAWREAACYTPRERAALAWAEALTMVAVTHAPDTDYDGLRPYFEDEEIVRLSLVITTINAWNRLAIGFRSVPARAAPAA